MSYYFSKTIESDFDTAVHRVKAALRDEGFGVLTEIDVSHVLKMKIGVDFHRYLILGACNPQCAHRALQIEDKIGTMLPCNVIVQELAAGRVEIAAVDPVASMQAIDNQDLSGVANEVGHRLKAVIERL